MDANELNPNNESNELRHLVNPVKKIDEESVEQPILPSIKKQGPFKFHSSTIYIPVLIFLIIVLFIFLRVFKVI